MAFGTQTLRNFEQVFQHFKCPVHLGKLRDPRRLPCDHTLCMHCLKGVIKTALKREDNAGMFECPVCRAGHHIPSVGKEEWADWFPVDAFTVIQLKTLARFQDSQICEVHTNKFKEYYCFHHRDLYCPDCVIEKHTTSPCYARKGKDAVHDVRKHIEDLVGDLRRQEARAERLTEPSAAATHTEDLLQKVWEVEHVIKRFQKKMQSRLDNARRQIDSATQVPPADKEHLKTIQGMIAQTKRHVEETLNATNTKTIEGQNDILRLWKPLDDEMQNLVKVLDAVEKRPFCVSVQTDDALMELISRSLEPLVVINESASWTPMAPSVRSGSVTTRKSSPPGKQKTAIQLPKNEKSILQSKWNRRQVSPLKLDGEAAVSPRSRSKHRKLPSLRHRGSTVSTTRQLTNSTGNLSNRSSERHRHFLPRLVAGNLTTGDASMVFNVKYLKLRAISVQSSFEFPCEDIVVLTSNIITITERAVQKFTLRYQFLESLSLRAPLKMCAMRDDSDNILVLDNNGGISLICTQGRLKVLHKVDTDRMYMNVCHNRTTTTEDSYGRCQCHLHLALTHVWEGEDCIDLIVVTYEKPERPGQLDNTHVTPAKVKTICGSNDDPVLKNIVCICTAPDSRRLLVGTDYGLVCLGRGGDILWIMATGKAVSSVECKRGHIFVAVEMAGAVVILDAQGSPLVENMIPPDGNIARPSRISLGKAAMVVKEVNARESSSHDQKSIVHVLNLTWM